jgi:hypothetical protein
MPDGAMNLTLDLITYSLLSEAALLVPTVNGTIMSVNRSMERRIAAVFLILALSLLFISRNWVSNIKRELLDVNAELVYVLS